MKKFTYALFLASACAAISAGCAKNEPEKIDLSSIHTTAAETMAAVSTTTAPTEATEAATTAQIAIEGNTSGSSIKTTLQTYKSGNIVIEYPQVSISGDSAKANSVNERLKNNAIVIIEAYELTDADAVDIECQVISADQKRLTALYTGTVSIAGAAHPTNVFYSNTVDMNRVTDIGFSTFADPYTMAAYVLSDTCEFYGVDAAYIADARKAIREAADNPQDYYTGLFQNADFPIDGDFPSVFSYERQGTVYFSVPVPHAVGDYVIVKYTPETK